MSVPRLFRIAISTCAFFSSFVNARTRSGVDGLNS
jgi:hypothetical protein